MAASSVVRGIGIVATLVFPATAGWVAWDHFARMTRPVPLEDPDAVLSQCEPSRDGRWLALGLGRGSVGGDATLYLCDLGTGAFRRLGEGMLAPIAWDEAGMLRFLERGEGRAEVRWVDPESLEVKRVAEDRDRLARGLAKPPVPSWAERRESRLPDGTLVQRIAWIGQGRSVEIPSGALHSVQVAETPGVVFHLERVQGARRLVRHDLASGTSAEIVPLSESLVSATASPDGRAVIVGERTRAGSSIRVIHAKGGRTIAGPWNAARAGWARWQRRFSSRYVTVCRDGACELLDLETSRSLPIGDSSWNGDVEGLDGGRLLVRSFDVVELRDLRGRVLRRVFPPER